MNLCAGLDRLGVAYTVNRMAALTRDDGQLACVVGKPFLLDRAHPNKPILFGASIYSHPLDDPDLLTRRNIVRILTPGDWMTDMCRPYWGARVYSWPVGIDVAHWDRDSGARDIDVLIYNKIRWRKPEYERDLLSPILKNIKKMNMTMTMLKYGEYNTDEYRGLLSRSRAMIFLCEHETQGIAYQEALSSGVPVLAWDRGGAWQDPAYYPDRVVYGPVSSVPYFDERCGEKFANFEQFESIFPGFFDRAGSNYYKPRDYILENLTLEKSAKQYLDHVRACSPI